MPGGGPRIPGGGGPENNCEHYLSMYLFSLKNQ